MNDFFEKKLKCTNVPKQVLEFYAKCDGKDLKINKIFSKKEILEEMDNFKHYLNTGIKHNKNNFLIPIANDGMGGYYAFVGNKEDENIYYFDHEFADEDPEIYTINDIINMDLELTDE